MMIVYKDDKHLVQDHSLNPEIKHKCFYQVRIVNMQTKYIFIKMSV